MRAQRGDWLVIKGPTIGKPDQRALIVEVRNPDGTPPYVVRWPQDDHVSTIFPGADAVVVSEAEQNAADEAERARLAAVREAIAVRYWS
ncbi:DUF1918 domain-containing protein [Amycolatopsis keratiniphila]|uniref:DUF1918 domain-containing protein n=1 Tax=Amycolatopsis keratiniphila subsp. keratiniphila TaxID=227715 RepID=A0A1W2M1F7_9PSEU|nr:DUF1918 domain-containing protein [Amycolatopsis keratiniphila]ONF73647.1 hypothetical protein AVR91_0205915 [Amycolatopsis keratiniphila subsp. keratiniphila]